MRGISSRVTGAEIAALRKQLSLGMRELALAIGAEATDIVAWESGERFPTKRHVARLRALEAAGPGAGAARREPAPAAAAARSVDPLARLRDPRLALVLRALCEDAELFEQVVALAERRKAPAS